jgi:hypothetical protein
MSQLDDSELDEVSKGQDVQDTISAPLRPER